MRDPDSSQRPYRDAVYSAGRAAIALGIGGLGGLGAHFGGLPLPWMLGPLFVTAALALLGVPIQRIGRARMAGQAVVGASIGLQLSSAVLFELMRLTPVIVAMTIVSTGIGMLGGVILTRFTKVDRTTAFFATTPGGVVEMANQAARHGGQIEVISVVQVMRVSFIVMAAPLLVIAFTETGGGEALRAPSVRWDVFLAVLAPAVLGGLAMWYFDLPSAWFLGPLFVAAAISTFDVVSGRAPDLLLVAAQITMGTSLGTQFRREFVTRLFPVLLGGLAAVVFSTLAHAAIGAALGYALGFPIATMVLALAPGGMVEMVLTAKLLELDAMMVMGFQLLRIIMLLILCRPAYRLFMRLTEPGSRSAPS